MVSALDNARGVLLSPEEQEMASGYIESLQLDTADFQVVGGKEIPKDLNKLIRQVLRAVRNDERFTVSTLPNEITTSTAARLLGVSRPTVMKYITNRQLEAHKVGSHHRLWARDVLSLRETKKLERQRAVFELLDAEAELEG